MFIVIYEKFMNRDGTPAERPLAMFRNPNEARVYLSMIEKTGRQAFARAI